MERDKQQNGERFDLESILAEFASDRPDSPPTQGGEEQTKLAGEQKTPPTGPDESGASPVTEIPVSTLREQAPRREEPAVREREPQPTPQQERAPEEGEPREAHKPRRLAPSEPQGEDAPQEERPGKRELRPGRREAKPAGIGEQPHKKEHPDRGGKKGEKPDNITVFPTAQVRKAELQEKAPEEPPKPGKRVLHSQGKEDHAAPSREEKGEQSGKRAGKQPSKSAQKQPEKEPEPEEKLIEFPEEEEEENPLTAGLEKLRQKADSFASQMYRNEGEEESDQVLAAEALIPGVDVEQTTAPVRKRRRELPRAPDTPPAELAKRYGRGIKSSGVRCWLVFLMGLVLWYLTLAGGSSPLPLPSMLEEDTTLRCYLLAGGQVIAMLLGLDGLMRGFLRPFQLRFTLETVMALSQVFVLADALTLPLLGGETGRQPLCAVAVLVLWSDLYGELQKRKGQRLACRTAAAVSAPYLVTRDSGKWNGRDTYEKWSGPMTGFGSQIQDLDGAEQIYGIWTPVLLAACVCFAIIATLGRKRPEDLLWALGAILLAACSLSTTLCFGLPWRKLSARLAKSGAALAGWEGAVNTTGGSNLVLCDHDLFAPGTVKMNGLKIFGSFPTEKVIAVTATLIRDSGSGLDKPFHDLLRSQGAIYRRGEDFAVYEGGGVSETIRGEQILVGSASFMVLMNISLPQGLNVKNAVFCAIDGELAGIFALKYDLAGAVTPALDSLIHNGITPVLATRDFNLIPAMLRQRFRLPVEKMEFPPVERRRELSDPAQDHSDTLTAVLCREGVSPFAEAVVGAKRLRSSVRLATVLSCIGTAVGALLAFYLVFVGAYASLTPSNLAVFLLLWLVPTPLVTGGV